MAENCCEAPDRTVADEGVILIPELPLRVQPDMNNAANGRAQQRMQVCNEFLDIRIIESLVNRWA
jgi:hypothetical protein